MSRPNLSPFIAVCVLWACSPTTPPAATTSFSAPVGVEIGASGDVPALTLAISLSRGAALEAVVEPLTTALHAGLRACPTYVADAAKGEVDALVLTLDRRSLSAAPAAVETSGTRCMAEQVGSATLSTPEDLKLKARVRVIIQDPKGQK